MENQILDFLYHRKLIFESCKINLLTGYRVLEHICPISSILSCIHSRIHDGLYIMFSLPFAKHARKLLVSLSVFLSFSLSCSPWAISAPPDIICSSFKTNKNSEHNCLFNIHTKKITKFSFYLKMSNNRKESWLNVRGSNF